jgi:hypothetical protein
MPCSKCGSTLVMLNRKVVCPICEDIEFLDKQSTIDLLARNMEELDQQILSHLKQRVSKNRILVELAWQRECFSRNLFSQYQTLDLSAFLSYNLLIFRIMKEPPFNSKLTVKQSSEVEELVKPTNFTFNQNLIFFFSRKEWQNPFNAGKK